MKDIFKIDQKLIDDALESRNHDQPCGCPMYQKLCDKYYYNTRIFFRVVETTTPLEFGQQFLYFKCSDKLQKWQMRLDVRERVEPIEFVLDYNNKTAYLVDEVDFFND